MTTEQEQNGIFGELISSYSRREAINDGVLIDLSEQAKRFGFRLPTAFTSALFERIISEYCARYALEPSSDEAQSAAILAALARLFRAIQAKAIADLDLDDLSGEPTDRLNLDFLGIEKHRPIKAWALVGPGDTREPVLTVMLEGED